MKSNQLIVGSLVVIALSIAYFLLIYLPRQQELKSRQQENTLTQQETNLRKQAYETCLKEFEEINDKRVEFWIRENPAITKQELGEKLMPIILKQDEIISNCVEKRFKEYRK